MDQETYLNRKIPKATKKIWAKANGGNRYLELFMISAIPAKSSVTCVPSVPSVIAAD